jgi:dTDP-4-dehydrorhamnose reductase
VKVLITGCNGLVACSLTKWLHSNGAEVLGTSVSGLTNPYLSREKYLPYDLTSADAPKFLLDAISPDVLVHTAAMTKPDVCELQPEVCRLINTEASGRLITEAAQRNIRSVFLSSDFVFSGNHPPHDENSLDFPAPNVYGLSKKEAEDVVMRNHPSAAIVRTALVYGFEPLLPRSNIFTWLLGELRFGRRVRVVSDQYRMPTYCDDLASGLGGLCFAEMSGIFHLAGADYLSVYEFALAVAEVFGFDADLIIPVETASLGEPAKRPPRTQLISLRAQTDLGYAPGSLEENLVLLRKKMEG